MRTSIVGPLGLGALAGIAGVAGAVGAGWPVFACVAAYSLCGAAGLLGGAVLNYRAVTAEEARQASMSSPAEAAPVRRLASAGG